MSHDSTHPPRIPPVQRFNSVGELELSIKNNGAEGTGAEQNHILPRSSNAIMSPEINNVTRQSSIRDWDLPGRREAFLESHLNPNSSLGFNQHYCSRPTVEDGSTQFPQQPHSLHRRSIISRSNDHRVSSPLRSSLWPLGRSASMEYHSYSSDGGSSSKNSSCSSASSLR